MSNLPRLVASGCFVYSPLDNPTFTKTVRDANCSLSQYCTLAFLKIGLLLELLQVVKFICQILASKLRELAIGHEQLPYQHTTAHATYDVYARSWNSTARCAKSSAVLPIFFQFACWILKSNFQEALRLDSFKSTKTSLGRLVNTWYCWFWIEPEVVFIGWITSSIGSSPLSIQWASMSLLQNPLGYVPQLVLCCRDFLSALRGLCLVFACRMASELALSGLQGPLNLIGEIAGEGQQSGDFC